MPLADLSPWTWFVVGGVLLVAEIFAPGTFLLWLGIAALITGVIASFLAPPIQVTLVLFAIIAVVSVVVGRRVTPRAEKASDRPFLNQRAQGYVGRVFRLDEPIRDGTGRIRIADTVWRVEGPELEAGQEVRVISAEGATLKVEAA